MRNTAINMRRIRLAAATLAVAGVASMSMASTQDLHGPSSDYDGTVLVEHAEFIPFGADGFAGYLTIWNGSASDRVIRSIEVEAVGKADLAKRVSDDVVRSMLDTAVVTVPPKSELHMDVDTVFLLLNGSMPANSARVIVRFEDGSSTTAKARFMTDRTSLTDHHHPTVPKP
jgi:copper(I)-binding protein